MAINAGKTITSKELLNSLKCDNTRLIISINDDYYVDQIRNGREVLFPTLGRCSMNKKQEFYFRDRDEIFANKRELPEEEFKQYLYDRAIRVNNEIREFNRVHRRKSIVKPKRPVMNLKDIHYDR